MNKQTGVALLSVVVVGSLFYLFGFLSPVSTPEQNSSVGVTPLEERAAAVLLVGTWRSTDDPNFVREFREGGIIIDRYLGNASAEVSGSWIVYTAATAPAGLLFEPDSRFAYVRITAEGETYDFALTNVSESELQMIFMDRGGVLSFTRVE